MTTDGRRNLRLWGILGVAAIATAAIASSGVTGTISLATQGSVPMDAGYRGYVFKTPGPQDYYVTGFTGTFAIDTVVATPPPHSAVVAFTIGWLDLFVPDAGDNGCPQPGPNEFIADGDAQTADLSGKKILLQLVVKDVGTGHVEIPVDYDFPVAIHAGGCAYLTWFGGGFESYQTSYTATSTIQLKYRTQPFSTAETADAADAGTGTEAFNLTDEFCFRLTACTVSAPDSGTSQAFEHIWKFDGGAFLHSLEGNIGLGPVPEHDGGITGTWHARNLYYLDHTCRDIPADAGLEYYVPSPGDYFANLPPDASVLFDSSLQGTGVTPINQVVHQPLNVAVDAGECIVHLGKTDANGGLSMEQQIWAIREGAGAKTLALNAAKKIDFNGDTQADTLEYDWGSGVASLCTGGSPACHPQLALPINSAWTLPPAAATGDFDGDGKTDLFWYRTDTGATAIWQSGIPASVEGPAVPPVSGWVIVGVGDFDGDGKSDVLWYKKDTGDTAFWWSGQPGSLGAAAVPPSSGWVIIGIGDFDGDGKSDILWYKTDTGATSIWYSGNPGVEGATVPAGSAIIDIVDGAGRSDILLQNLSDWTTTVWPGGSP